MTLTEKLQSIARQEEIGVLHEIDGQWWFTSPYFMVTIPGPFEIDQGRTPTLKQASDIIAKINAAEKTPVIANNDCRSYRHYTMRPISNEYINEKYFRLAPADAQWLITPNRTIGAESEHFRLIVQVMNPMETRPTEIPTDDALYPTQWQWFAAQQKEREEEIAELREKVEEAEGALEEAEEALRQFVEKHGAKI